MKSEHNNPADHTNYTKNILINWVQDPAYEPEAVANQAALLAIFTVLHHTITLAESISDEGSDEVIASIKSKIQEFISEYSLPL